MRFHFVKQLDAMQCGVACLAMICKYYNHAYNIETLSEICKKLSTKIAADYYHEQTVQSLKPYRNAIIVNLQYRFNTGSNKQSHKRSMIETEERISGGLDL